MDVLARLEEGGLGEWVRSSTMGYPLMIACHAIGMAIMVGLSLGLDMRLLGLFPGIPVTALNRFLGIAWAGFGLNFLSGAGLFAAQATTYVTDGTFLLKMGLVLAGVVTVAILQSAIGRGGSGWADSGAPLAVRSVAVLSIACWVGATVTGRLIAYL